MYSKTIPLTILYCTQHKNCSIHHNLNYTKKCIKKCHNRLSEEINEIENIRRLKRKRQKYFYSRNF